MWRKSLNLTNFLNEPYSNNVRFLSHFEEFLFRKLFRFYYISLRMFAETTSIEQIVLHASLTKRMRDCLQLTVSLFSRFNNSEEYCFYGGSQRKPAAEN